MNHLCSAASAISVFFHFCLDSFLKFYLNLNTITNKTAQMLFSDTLFAVCIGCSIVAFGRVKL